MNNFTKELNDRRARVDTIITALSNFREAYPSYAFQAGVFESQLMSLAADNKDSTNELVRLLDRIVANKQQYVQTA